MSDLASLHAIAQTATPFAATDSAAPKYAPVPVRRIEDRIQRIFRAVVIGVTDPTTRLLVAEGVKDCKGRDEWCEVETGFHVLRELIQYRNDPSGLDLFQTLQRSIETRAGDCGSFTGAMCTWLATLGYACGACVIAQGNDWDHVYAVGMVPGAGRLGKTSKRMAFDLSEPGVRPGWEPQAWRYRMKHDYWFDAEKWVAWYYQGANDATMPGL
jgi:hypothetical protein